MKYGEHKMDNADSKMNSCGRLVYILSTTARLLIMFSSLCLNVQYIRQVDMSEYLIVFLRNVYNEQETII